MRYQIMTSVLAILMIDLDKVCKAEDPKQQQRERSLKTEHLAQSHLAYAASLAHHNKEEKLNGPIESATESQRSLCGGTDYHHDTSIWMSVFCKVIKTVIKPATCRWDKT